LRIGEVDEQELIQEFDRVGAGNTTMMTTGGDMSVLASLNATRALNLTHQSGIRHIPQGERELSKNSKPNPLMSKINLEGYESNQLA